MALDLICLRQDYIHSYCLVTEGTSYPLAPSPPQTHPHTDADSGRGSTPTPLGGISVVPAVLLLLLKTPC